MPKATAKGGWHIMLEFPTGEGLTVCLYWPLPSEWEVKYALLYVDSESGLTQAFPNQNALISGLEKLSNTYRYPVK